MKETEENEGSHQTQFPDELDLVGIGAVSWRYRWLAVGVMLGILVPGAVAAFWIPEKHAVLTAVELGLITVDGVVQPVEPVETVVAKLENSYIPAELHTVQLPENMYKQTLSIEVDAGKSSTLVILKSQATRDRFDLYKKIHANIVENLVADHARVTDVIEGTLKKNLALARIELEELQDQTTFANKLVAVKTSLASEKIELGNLRDPKIFQVSRKSLENSLAAAREKLVGFDGRIRYLEKELSGLETSRGLILSQIQETRDFIKGVRSKRLKMTGAADESADVMAALLLDSEIQKNIGHLATLENRLYIEIPTRHVGLQNELQDTERQRQLQKEEIALLEDKLVKLNIEHTRAIEQKLPVVEELETQLAAIKADYPRQISQQQVAITALESQLQNLRKTRMVTLPQVSLKPVGIGKLPTLAAVLFLSGFMAVLAVMMAVFFKAVRSRILDEEKHRKPRAKPGFDSHFRAA